MKEQEARNIATRAIVFMQLLLKHYYGDESSFYVQYIKKGLRRFGSAMEQIRIIAIRENRKKRKIGTKNSKLFLKLIKKCFMKGNMD